MESDDPTVRTQASKLARQVTTRAGGSDRSGQGEKLDAILGLTVPEQAHQGCRQVLALPTNEQLDGLRKQYGYGGAR
jgi:hypothetical protein